MEDIDAHTDEDSAGKPSVSEETDTTGPLLSGATVENDRDGCPRDANKDDEDVCACTDDHKDNITKTMSVETALLGPIETIENRKKTELQGGAKVVTFDTGIDKERTGSKYAQLKDLLSLSLAFTFTFSSYSSYEGLQSSLNLDDSLGTTSLTILYSSMLVTNLFLTPLTLSRVSYKTAMVVSMTTYAVYIAAGFKPTWETVMPASVVIGIGAAHLWPAQQAILTQLARDYAHNTGGLVSDALSLFTGVFFCFMKSSHIWGNLFSSLVFASNDGNQTTNTSAHIHHCGRHMCPFTNISSSTLQRPSSSQITIYISTCVAVTGIGILTMMACCLATPTRRSQHKVNICKNLQMVGRLLVHSTDQQLLIMSTLFAGLSMSFIAGDFTLSFVTCPFGVSRLGYVMVVYGTVTSVCSALFGRLSKYTGTYFFFLLAFIIQSCVGVTLLAWSPNQDQYAIVFIIAGLLGVVTAIHEPMLSVLYSLYFKDQLDVALSSFRMLCSLGMAITFGYSHWLCMNHKLYIYIICNLAAFCGMTALHIKYRNNKKDHHRPEWQDKESSSVVQRTPS